MQTYVSKSDLRSHLLTRGENSGFQTFMHGGFCFVCECPLFECGSRVGVCGVESASPGVFSVVPADIYLLTTIPGERQWKDVFRPVRAPFWLHISVLWR